MLVYREGRRRQSSTELKAELASAVEAVRGPDSPECLSTLLCAADLECALSDLTAPSAAQAAELTSDLASYWLSPDRHAPVDARRVLALELPEELEQSRAEGYAYYGLHPRSYVTLAAECPLPARRAAVIGIRSIGTSLSAVVRATLVRRGVSAERLTVRPIGHPWARNLALSESEQRFVDAHRDAGFFVVDEGPGLSGSTFLAVGEALLARGVPAECITFFCSHAVDPGALLAEQAEERWGRFRAHSAAAFEITGGARDLSFGRWRDVVYGPDGPWPDSWVARERIKFLTSDGLGLVKFEGLPPYGVAPLERAQALAQAAFGPEASAAEPGFVRYRWCDGSPADGSEPRHTVIPRLASYVAFRARHFGAEPAPPGALEAMVHVNVAEALGHDLGDHFELPVAKAIVVDGRMMPHEWIVRDDGVLLKSDGVAHGDDHLFPGPTDSAWDLAGAIVEWGFDAAAAEALLACYQRETGDDARPRLAPYLVAYAAFQLGCAEFAARGAEPREHARIQRARARYEAVLRRSIAAI